MSTPPPRPALASQWEGRGPRQRDRAAPNDVGATLTQTMEGSSLRLLFLRFWFDQSHGAVGAMVDDVDAFAVGVAEDDGARVRAVERIDGFLDAHGF